MRVRGGRFFPHGFMKRRSTNEKQLSGGDIRFAAEWGVKSRKTRSPNQTNTTMKTKLFLIPGLIASLFLTSCKDEQTTTVSKSLWGGDTIVSRSDSSGTYTRTEYGSDLFGNKTISVSRGHENATEQGDLGVMILKGVASVFGKSGN
jgi:hypothetical protein